ncbi:MAG: hypothetical protein ACK4M5_05595, partial [Dietzia cercidiphylli]
MVEVRLLGSAVVVLLEFASAVPACRDRRIGRVEAVARPHLGMQLGVLEFAPLAAGGLHLVGPVVAEVPPVVEDPSLLWRLFAAWAVVAGLVPQAN